MENEVMKPNDVIWGGSDMGKLVFIGKAALESDGGLFEYSAVLSLWTGWCLKVSCLAKSDDEAKPLLRENASREATMAKFEERKADDWDTLKGYLMSEFRFSGKKTADEMLAIMRYLETK